MTMYTQSQCSAIYARSRTRQRQKHALWFIENCIVELRSLQSVMSVLNSDRLVIVKTTNYYAHVFFFFFFFNE